MGRPHLSLGKKGKWEKNDLWQVISFPMQGKNSARPILYPEKKLTREKIDRYSVSYIETCICRSDPQKSEPLYDDDEEEEILGSDDDEQEDPKDYCKGTKHHN